MSDQNTVWIKVSALDEQEFITSPNKRGRRRIFPTYGKYLDDANEKSNESYDWVLGSIVSKQSNKDTYSELDNEITLVVSDEECPHFGKEITVPSSLLKSGDVVIANQSTLSQDLPPHDLINLTHLHEPAVVHCLQKRFQEDIIYTATGPILLAVNPFKKCRKLYNHDAINQYRDAGNESSLKALPPHVFGIADAAFRAMMHGLDLQRGQIGASQSDSVKVNQSILVSGESGAGKTVSTKHIMRYLANLSSHNDDSKSNIKTMSPENNSVEKKVLQSNPILESFGNARTIRNDNSSRFGKFIELQFQPTSHKTAVIMGAKIETYLLEKVRLVIQAPGERNYHIFYEILEGIENEKERSDLFLNDNDVNDFRITSMSGTFDRRDQIEDYDTYNQMRQAMTTMDFDADEQTNVMRITSAILHASNLTFDSLSADESKIDQSNNSFEPFLTLMGLSAEKVNDTLCYSHIHTRGETYKRQNPKEKAMKGLEALMKATYAALFNRIVDQINKEISVSNVDHGRKRSMKAPKNSSYFIGVLDIFGFESFQKNSFEQLCINYCNEALQQQFNLFVFTNEQQEYRREGIEWTFIEFPDNQDVLDLIDQKGIIPILDDQCKAPKGSDEAFAEHIYERARNHPRFLADHLQIGSNNFGILHYAGPVEYDTSGFLEKNKDELPKESTDLLLSSSNPFVKKLAQSMMSAHPVGGANHGRRTKKTVGGQFILQLRSLRERIRLTRPHYVRCLKPNNALVSDSFDQVMIANQLRHAGVLEAVRVARVGFPQRYGHKEFFERYFCISVAEMERFSNFSTVARCKLLTNTLMPQLLTCRIPGENSNEGARDESVKTSLQMGKTKIFLRSEAFEKLEHLREQKMLIASIKIQAALRGYFAKQKYRNAIKAIVTIQCFTRITLAKNILQNLRRISSALTIQRIFRMKRDRNSYLSCLVIARWSQKMCRGQVGRKKSSALNELKNAIIIQKYWRMSINLHRFKLHLKSAVVIQCIVRSFHSRAVLQQLKADAKDLEKVIDERDALQAENRRLMEELEVTKRKLKKYKVAWHESVSDIKEKAGNVQVKLKNKIDEVGEVLGQKANYVRDVKLSIPQPKFDYLEKGNALAKVFTNEKNRRDSMHGLREISSERKLTKRRTIRVGRSRSLRDMRSKSTSDGMFETRSTASSKKDKSKRRDIDDSLISNMLALLDTRNTNDCDHEELEKLRAETEHLKNSMRKLKKNVKSQKQNDTIHNSYLRAPSMSCTLGPAIGGLFHAAQRPDDSIPGQVKEKNSQPPKEKESKKFLWWTIE